MAHAPSDIFVGREEELRVLATRLASAATGQGSIVLLSGEPGIGKSRTVDEFRRRAEAAGTEVLVGRCYEGSGAPPFWPWIQVVRGYAHARDEVTIRRDLDTAAADVAMLDPELRRRLDLPPPPTVEPEQARFRVFDGLTQTLVRAAALQPIVVVLEDLHGADKPSLLLLQFLARAIRASRVLVVATLREVALAPTHPVGETIAELVRERISEKLDLGGLTEREVELLLSRLATTPVSEAVAQAVHARTGGNPLYVTEIARALFASGSPGTLEPKDVWKIDVPETVRFAIARRLTPMSSRCRELLTTAALFGREFRMQILARASGRSTGEVLLLLDEARASGIVDTAPGDPDRFVFAHALIGETLVQDLGPSALAILHRRAAEALSRHPRADEHAAEVAHHWYSAGPSGDPSQAIAWTCRAAALALDALAYEEAERLYRMGLIAVGWQDEPDPAAETEICLGLGETLKREGDEDKAKEMFSRAAELARRLGSPELLTRAALGFAPRITYATQPEPDPRVTSLLEEAIVSWQGRDSGFHARALGRLALAKFFSDSEGVILSLANSGLEMARRVHDPSTLMAVLVVWLMSHQHDRRGRLEYATELVRMSEGSGDLDALAEGRLVRAMGLLEHGDAHGMRGEAMAFGKVVSELRQPVWAWRHRVFEGARAILEGRWHDAKACVQEALDVGQAALPYAAPAYFVGQSMFIRTLMGDDPEPFASHYRTALEGHPQPTALSPLVWVEAERGNLEVVRALVDRMMVDGGTWVDRDIVAPVSAVFLAEGCAALGDQIHAAWLYERLAATKLSWVVWAEGVPLGPIPYQLGLLARALDRLDDAVAHFAEALAISTHAEAWPYVARAQFEYAMTLHRRDARGDAEHAEALLSDAQATAVRLGMNTLVSKAAAASNPSARSIVPRDSPPHSGLANRFHREGEYWSLTYQGTTVRLKDAKGLLYIAYLLRHPQQDFHVADLAALGTEAAGGLAHERPSSREGNLGTILDSQATTSYRERLREVRSELELAETAGDMGHADRLRRESEAITDELGAAYGLGGRLRKLGDPSERQRKAVTNQIHRAITRVRIAHPELGVHLENGVRTGLLCSYRPERPIDWGF